MSADLPMAPLVPPTVEPTTAPAAVHFLAPRELVVLDGTLPDADTLREAIAADRPEADLLVLDTTRDALDQIGDRLAGGAPVSAIHLVAHGQAGQFVIRGAVIDASELARRTAQLQTWNLADHADILLYGCNIADGANGEAFVRMLAELTGADVAASTDLTGSEDRGGDWALEFVTGDVDTATIAGPRLKGRWHGTLDATPVAGGETALPSFSTPLAFERNAGQTDAAVEFLARGSGYTVFLDDGNAVIDVRHGDGTGNVVRLSLDGAQTPVASAGGILLSGTSHYLVGDVSDWHRDVAHYGSVRFDEVYDGIDVQYYGADRRLEYDFLVDAGVDTDVIGLRIEGAVAVEIAENGELVLTLDGTGRTMTFHAPVTYQRAADGSREHVDSRYVLRADGTVGFDLGDYDRSRDLVIDPILGYATYLGGTGLETIEGVETDSSGNVYVTGRTGSAAFPTSVGAYDTALGGSTDAFVTKFNSAGALQYSTYFGGSANEWAYNLTVDGSGQVYVVGETTSSDFAIVNGADSSFGGSTDGYLVKLNAAGSAILYSTFYGGANADYLGAVHMGSGSTVYVAGGTTAATWDGYAGAINTGASGAGSLTWSQTYAAAGTEKLYDMDVDSTGDIWLIGETSTAGLSTGSPYDSTHNGGADVFLVRMSASGAVEYVSYYGGTGNDYGSAIVVAADNTVYITGTTYSTSGIASTGAYDTTGDGTNGNAFLVHLDLSQTGSAQRLFGTYYGTSGATFGHEIAIDAEGRPVVVGQTSGTIPTTVTARDTTLSGSSDGFVAVFAANGTALRYASYAGGDGTESANAVAVDSAGRLYVVGQTASTTLHTSGAYDTTGDATNADGFIAQFLPLASAARTSGKGGLSINTDGGNDAYLMADNGGTLLGGRTALTLEFDFAIGTNSSSDNTLFSYAVAGQSNEVTVNVKSTGVIELDIEFVTRATSVAYPQLLDGNRHQIAITWDRATGNGAFYVDGALVESFTGFKTGATIDGGGTLVLGQEQDSVGGGFSPSQMFSGTLYDVRVFSDVRTATEIRAGRLAELPRTESGMVANWRFDDWHTDGTTTEAVSGNDLTLGHASGTGFVASQPSLTFVMNENAATGTVVGSITALSDDRQARIDALLAADATLTYSAQTVKFYKRDTTFRTWASALSLATSTTLNTVAGQLVTVRSATENALLSSITGGSAVWLGAADASVEGTWRWYDGSTPADTFWQGTASGYRIDGAYTNWNAGEPSDTGGEDRLYQQADGTWNDAPDGMTSWTLIEWDADEVLDASQAITYSITSQTVSGAFAIDSDTGVLTVANGSSLNYVAGVPHTLTVRVTEGSLTYDRTYTVVLTDEVVEVSASTPGAQSVAEDAVLTFSSGGGNAISVSDGSGASNTRMQVSLSVSQGALNLSQTTGLTFVSGANGSAAMVVDGTESALNAALAGMTYTPTAQYSGSDTLQVTASLSSELAARYTFDTGAVVDSAAGTAQNGSFVGNATTTSNATRGTVLSLDGAGDSVQIASVFGNPSNVSVGGWVNLYSAGGRAEMISLDDRVHIALDDSGVGVKGSIQTGVGTWNDLESGRFIAGDGWHHVMFVVDDTNDVNTLYIDGVAVASETNTSSVYWTGATNTYLGQHPANFAYLQGLLDDMLVYTRALSADEVAALSAEQRTTDPDTVTLTVNAVNDAPEDLYFVPELAESSLTGVYTFSVGSDLGRDSAGEDAAMTLYGSPSQTTGPTGSGALDLAGGGSGQYGDIAGITTGGAMTIAAQVRFDSTGDWQRIVDFGQANSTGISAIYVGRFGNTSDLTFTIERDLGGGNWWLHRATATNAITNGTWMHFAATVDGTGAMSLYVNGVLADTEAGIVPEVGIRTNNFVGRSNWAGDALFDGAIDNLVVASGALSAAGVAALYQQSNAVTIADNAADGTVLGTIVVADIDSANTHTFGLTDSAAGRFAIAADGTLRVGMGSLLEYASATSHTLTARATDTGSLTRDEVFTVTLTAANEAPSFAPGDGKLTTNFGSSDDATAVAVQADGKIVIAGYSGATFIVGRYNADGTLDSTFGTGGLVTTLVGSSAAARAIALQSDGKILVAGTSFNGVNDDFALVRYNTDGSLDTTFDTDGRVTTAIGAGNDRGMSVAVQSDGKIVVGGTSHNGTNEDFALVRYTTSGALDTTFDTDGRVTTAVGAGDDFLTDIALQTDGFIVAVGYGSNGANNDFAVVRYSTNGALDTTFDTDGKVLTAIGSGADQAESVAIQSDGKIVVSGSASNGSNDDFALVRYDTNGALDTGFDTDGRVVTTFGGGTGHEYGSSVAIQTDGKIVVAGRTLVSGNSDFAIARYTAAGALDTTFDTDGKVTADFSGNGDLGRALAIQTDGKLVVAGMTWTGAGFDVGVTRHLANGALDTSFDSAFVTTLDGAPSYTEGGSFVVLDGNVSVIDPELSAADDFSGATLTLARNGGAVADDQFVFDGTTVTVSGANVFVSGTQVGTYVFTGGQLDVTFGANATQARVNTLMRNIRYGNASDAPPASVQIDWIFSDGNTGAQGSGGPLTATGSITVSITAVNDAPVVSGLDGDVRSYTEGDAAALVGSATSVADADSANFDGGTLTVSFTGGSDSAEDVLAIRNQGTGAGQIGVSGANVTYSGVIIGTWTGGTSGSNLVITLDADADTTATAALIDNITYVNTDTVDPTTTTRNIRFVLTDGDGGTSAASNTFMSVTAVTDAPVNTVPGAQSTAEDVTLVFSSTNGNAVSITDADAGAAENQVTLSVTQGQLTLSGTAGLTFTSGDGSADATMTFRGTASAINAALNGLSFAPAADYSGGATLTLATRDSVLLSLDIDADLLARYEFSSDAADTGAAPAENGVLTNGASVVSDATRGSVLNLDGTDDFVDLSGSVANFAGLSTGTIAGWIKFTGTFRTIFSVSDTADTGSYAALFLGASGYLTYEVVENGVTQLAVYRSSATINDDNWHHVAVTVDGSGNRLYVDGVLASAGELTYDTGNATTSRFFSSVTSLDAMAIGRNADSSGGKWYANGRLDEIRLYDRALASGEIAALAADLSLVDTDTVAVNVSATNDAPAFANLDGTPTHVEGGSPVVLDANVSVSDAELTVADAFSGATLTLARNGGANADDALAFDGTNVTVSGANVLVGGTHVGTYVFTGGELVVTFGANATQARVNTLLQNIVYWNWSDAPPASVQIDWTFNDGNTGGQGSGGALTATGSTTVTITAVNDAPVNTIPGLLVGHTPSNSNMGDQSYELKVGQSWGQSFAYDSAGATYSVSDVQLVLYRASDAPAGQTVTVSLRSAWNGSVIASGTVSTDSLSTSEAWVNVIFSSPATLNDNQSYVLRVDTGALEKIYVGVADSGTYASGHLVDKDGVTQSGKDMAFVLDAPLQTGEETPLTLSVAGGNALSVADVDAGSGSLQVSLTMTGGTVTLAQTTGLSFSTGDGTADATLVFSGTLAALNSALDGMTFLPADDFNGVASIALTTSDLGNTGSGGALVDSDIQSILVTETDDPPVFSGLDGAPTHVEGGAAVVLDANVTVSDVELTAADDFSGATLTLVRNGGANAEDALAFDGTNVTVSGANVLVGGTQVGNYVFTGGELIVTFGANATQARVNTLLQNIVYWNWSDAPPASVQIDWTFSDGNAGSQGSGGALQATGSTTVTISAVNDAPSGADGTILATEDTTYTFVPGDFGFSDADGHGFERVWIDTLPASGALLWNGSTITAGNWIDASDIAAGQLTYAPAADVTGPAVASFTFRVQDDGGTANGGSDTDPVANTITIDVTAVNDAPTRIVLDASGGSSIALNTTTAGDQSQPALAALPGGGSVAVWTSAGQDGDGTGIYAQRFDANGVAVGSEFRVNASATYHQGSPSVAAFSDGAFVVGWTEMQPGVAAWAEARVFAADGTPLTGDLTISVPLSNPNEGYAAQVQVLGPNRWAIVWSNEVNGATRSVEGRIFDRGGVAQTAQFTVGTSGAAPDSWAVVPRATGLADGGMAVTWNHHDTFSQTTIRVQFVNTDGTLRGAYAELSGTGIGDITQLPDGRVVVLSTDGATVYATVFSSAGAIVVPDFVVTSLHTAASWPQVTASGDGFVTARTALADDGMTQEIVIQRYDAAGAPLGVATRARPSADGAVGDISLTTLADGSALLGWRADGLDGSGGGAYAGALQAAVREGAANGTVVAGAIDVLDPDGGDTHTFSLFDDAGGRFTIDGVTGRITVVNGGLLDYETGTTHTIILRATDGGGLSVDRSLTIAVLPVNEAPAFANLDGTPTFTENGSPVVLDGDLTVSDVELTATDDFNGATLTLARNGGASAQDQFSATGTLGMLTQGGNLVVGGTTIGTVTTHGAGSLVLTFNASATNALVNSAMQQIAYANASDTPPASVQIDWTFSDGNAGTQGSGGALTATGSTTVSITAVNDAPTGAVAITGSAAEGETLSADTSGLADADGLGAFAYQWLRDGAPIAGATAASHTLVSGDVGRGISVRVSYSDGGGTQEQITSAAVGPVTLAPTPPVNTAPANAAPVEDTPFAFAGADTISIADGDGNLTTVSASVSFGSLVLTLTGGATVSAGALGSAAFTLSGSLAALNASLASLTYTPDADFDGTDTLTLVSTDATALSDTDTITLSVTPVDDAPVLTGLTLSVSQGGSTALSTADFTIVDPDGPGGTRVVDVRNLSQGMFELATAPGVPVTSFDFADVAAGLVRFVHSGTGAAPSFEASVRDTLTPGTFVPAAVGFTPTPVVTTPGPSPEEAYSIVLTPTTPPSATPQEPSGPTRPADPVTTGTASQSGEAAQSAGGRGERSPGSVDPRILMQMAVPRTPAAAGGDASANADAGRSAATIGPAGGSAGVAVSAPAAAPVGSSGVPAGAQVPTAEAVTPDTVQSAWNAPAPLTVALPGEADTSGPEKRSAEEQQFDIMVNGVRLTGVSLSVGVVTWALRAGGIVSSLLASLPAWRFVDPLPVLERAERARVVWRDDEDDDGDGDDTAKRDRAVEDLFGGPT